MDEYSSLARNGFYELVVASSSLLALIITVTLISAKRNKQCIPFHKDYWVAKNHIYLAEHHHIQWVERDLLSKLSYSATIPIAEYLDRMENGEAAFNTTEKQSQADVVRVLSSEWRRHQRAIDRLAEKYPVMGFPFSGFHAKNAFQELSLDDENMAP